jgi:hypothetical protein
LKKKEGLEDARLLDPAGAFQAEQVELRGL